MGKLSAALRKKSATVVQKNAPPGQQQYRFPIPDKAHARLALAMLKRAKNLSPAQKAEIKKRAEAVLAGSGK